MTGPRCVFAGRDGHLCNGRLQWHHPIKKQRLRDRFPRGAWRSKDKRDEWKPMPRGALLKDLGLTGQFLPLRGIIDDPRNRIWACWDAHQAIEGDVSNLSASVWEFAREFGFDAQLENDIARRRPAGERGFDE